MWGAGKSGSGSVKQQKASHQIRLPHGPVLLRSQHALQPPLPRGALCLVHVFWFRARLGVFPLPSSAASITQDMGAQIDPIPHSTASFILTAQSPHHLIARLWMNVPEADEMHRCLPRTHKCHGNSNSTTTAMSQAGIRQPREPTICKAKPSKWCLF